MKEQKKVTLASTVDALHLALFVAAVVGAKKIIIIGERLVEETTCFSSTAGARSRPVCRCHCQSWLLLAVLKLST